MCDHDVGHRAASGAQPGRGPAAGARAGCVPCAGRGRQGAFEHLYDGTVDHVHHLALLMSRGDAEHADRLVRETYAAVRRRAGEFRPEEHRTLTWVLQIASEVGRGHPPPGPGPRRGRVA